MTRTTAAHDAPQPRDSARAVAWAVENGIINGVELRDGTLELRATETMSRAQMAAMILNAIDAGAL